LRGLARLFGIHRQSVSQWIVEHIKSLPAFQTTILPARPDDVLECDEAWSFVLKKVNKRWLWTVMCRRTRQIIAFVIGDRSKKTCRRLWLKLPDDYRHCISYTDFWEAYQKVFPKNTHRAVGKDSGHVSHMERWYCTLRQRQARYVRKTLSFSKSDHLHRMVTKWYIAEHNLAIQKHLSLTS
jgi:IS1 family transposase